MKQQAIYNLGEGSLEIKFQNIKKKNSKRTVINKTQKYFYLAWQLEISHESVNALLETVTLYPGNAELGQGLVLYPKTTGKLHAMLITSYCRSIVGL